MKWLTLVLTLLAGSGSLASDIRFTEREQIVHDRNIRFIAEDAAFCLMDTWDTHLSFYDKWGVSKYYGDRNQSLNTRGERLTALARAGVPQSLINELEPTSCVGMTLRCLGGAFQNTRDLEAQALWNKILGYVRANEVSGSHLILALQQLGWKVMYWNPNPSRNKAWDQEDPRNLQGKPVSWNSGTKNSAGQFIYNPGWGMHETRYRTVMNSNKYYINPVDDKHTLVGFGEHVPAELKRSPFFVGIAHAGYHVFPGVFGEVIEAHSTRALTSVDNLERSEFNPLATGGGPRWTRSEKYRSGLIALPPQ